MQVTTDVPCDRLTGVAIGIGQLGEVEGKAAASTSTSCVDGRVGALVIVPSGSDDEAIAFRVAAGIDRNFEECVGENPGAGCIVARRALRFLPHTPLTVPIALNAACNGVSCTPDTTCVNRACVPAAIDPAQCAGSGCPETALYPDAGAPSDAGIDATLDAGDAVAPDASDASDASDAGTDGSVITAAVPGCDMGGLEPNAPWPMQGYCPTHRHRSPLTGPKTKPHLLWNTPVAGLINNQPIVAADGSIYVVSTSNNVYALKPDGTSKWTYAFDAGGEPPLVATPAIAKNGSIYVATGEGSVLRLDPATGAASTVPGVDIGTRDDLTIGPDGTLYMTDTAITLYAVDPATGVRWTSMMDAGVDPNPVSFSNGTVYAQTSAGLVELSPNDGHVVTGLHYSGGNEGVGEPMIAPSGDIVVGTNKGNFFGIAHGNPPSTRWTYTSAGVQIAYSVGDDGTAYISTDNDDTTAIAPDGGIAARYAQTGCNAPVIDAEGWLYMMCPAYHLVGVDPTLTERWNIDLSKLGTTNAAPSDSPVIGAGGVLYFTIRNDGSLPDVVVAVGP